MAADGVLRRLFEKPLPENPTLLEVLSATSCGGNHIHHHHKKQLLPVVDPASFTEIFGELHFQEKPDADRVVLPPPVTHHHHPAAPATVSWLDVAEAAEKSSKDDSSLDALLRPTAKPASFATGVKRSASFCVKSSAALLLCTEGLGSESTVDADDMVKDDDDGDDDALRDVRERARRREQEHEEEEDRPPPPSFPPPIRSIGRGGKACVCFRSFRADGRFVLRQVVIPGKDLLHASREDGRLTLRFANTAAGVDPELGAHQGDDYTRRVDTCVN